MQKIVKKCHNSVLNRMRCLEKYLYEYFLSKRDHKIHLVDFKQLFYHKFQRRSGFLIAKKYTTNKMKIDTQPRIRSMTSCSYYILLYPATSRHLPPYPISSRHFPAHTGIRHIITHIFQFLGKFRKLAKI